MPGVTAALVCHTLVRKRKPRKVPPAYAPFGIEWCVVITAFYHIYHAVGEQVDDAVRILQVIDAGADKRARNE
jgi:hypothetical protein